jgi:iron complex transport system substrate-binding protein
VRGARLLAAALVLALWAAGAGCADAGPDRSPGPAGLGGDWAPAGSLDLAYAEKFSVDYLADGDGSEYALIKIADGSRYLVAPEGAEAPADVPEGTVLLERPLSNLYVAASATMSLFAALGGLDAVRFSSLAADKWHVPEAKAAMESGKILFGGRYSAPDYELILQSKPSLAVENNMISHSPKVKERLEELGIPVLVEHSSYEPHPLGRTEWIKLFGVLLGKEALAGALFDAQAAHLEDLSGQPGTGASVAFFHISSAGYAVARKSGDYIAKMIELAGGRYVFDSLGDSSATSTVNLEMERFYATAKDADFIIYNSAISGDLSSIAELTALNPLLADFKAVRDGRVWCTDQDFYQDMTGLGQMISDIHDMLADPDRAGQLAFLHRVQ